MITIYSVKHRTSSAYPMFYDPGLCPTVLHRWTRFRLDRKTVRSDLAAAAYLHLFAWQEQGLKIEIRHQTSFGRHAHMDLLRRTVPVPTS